MSLVTPETIRTLQRKLYTKAKQAPAYCFYARYDKLRREDLLRHAGRRVRSHGGSPGVDGTTFEAIEHGEGVDGFLRELARALQDKDLPRATGTARPDPYKADGRLRPLGIPTLRDRVVQRAVKLIIEPIVVSAP